MFLKVSALIFGLAALAPAANMDFNNPTGTQGLIMIDKLGGFVRFFDPVSLAELSSFSIPDGPPHELTITPDHKTAYIPIYGDGVYGRNPHPGHIIAIVDLASKKMTGTIDVSPYIAPHGLQVDANGTLYATCDLSRKFLVIDPKTRSITAAIDTEGTGHWIAVLPDGSKAYVANKNDRPFVSVIDVKARKMTGKISMPNGTQGITVSPDGKRVLAVDYKDPKFFVIDTKTDQLIDTVAVEKNTRGPFRIKYSPDGLKLVTCDDQEGLANVFSTRDLHGAQQVLTVGKTPFGIAFSADSKTALVSNHGDGTISVIDLPGSKVVKTFKAGTGIETLSYY
ncbi:MAG TPA: YncE family protein [Bryobacteraceae bacterium]